MNRDTLLLVTTSYPEQRDGSEAAGAFVADLADVLSERMPVRVVAPGTRAGSVEANGAVTVRRFASPGKPLSLLSMGKPSDWSSIARTLLSMRAQTLASDCDNRVAHTLALWVLPSGWAAAALHKAHGVPYSVWALGSDIWTLGRMPLARSMLRRVILGATHRYADGLQLSADAARIAGVPFSFLPSTRRIGSQCADPLASAPPYRLLFLGRWHPNKGVDLLLDALALLDEATWSRIAEIRIAGGGPLENLMQARVSGLRAVGRPIRLDGFLDAEQAASAIANADWLLLPSRIESIPVVFSDAVKLGRPVITMPVGDLTDLVAAQPPCGVVAEKLSATAFASAIARALEVTPQSFEAGIRRASRMFDLDQVGNKVAAAAIPR